jgi:hypothetical protein
MLTCQARSIHMQSLLPRENINASSFRKRQMGCNDVQWLLWDLKTVRRVSTYPIHRPEASPYQPVDVVSPIDATGHH